MRRIVWRGVPRRAAASLALVAIALAGCGGSSGPHAVEVRMRYSKFLPAALHVSAGTTVEFTLVNTDPIDHEFLLGTDLEQKAHELAPANDPHTGPGEAAVPAGKTVHLSYTFAKAGTLIYACHRPGHYRYGMKGTVNIAA